MCESTAYILRDGKEEMFFEGIESLENRNDEVKMVNIFGEVKTINAKIKRFSLVDHKIILEPN
ncbi:MAG: CooT family nickel-binding protein [Proteobacteria bacterium]|nr:CooT family nickel-binding protein [Pseudomonadota bacterium]MBU1905299.1 CooT family nickel-binding protein [Pseudomonadota bacterium]